MRKRMTAFGIQYQHSWATRQALPDGWADTNAVSLTGAGSGCNLFRLHCQSQTLGDTVVPRHPCLGADWRGTAATRCLQLLPFLHGAQFAW